MNRFTRAVVVALMVTAPAAYLVVAAVQSLNGSDMKERVAAATTMVHERPDRATRNIYGVPMNYKATGKKFFETNSWKSSSLYARFTTIPRGLDWFLKQIGTSRDELVEGKIPISRERQQVVGWDFHGEWAADQHFYGVSLPAEKKGQPAREVLVNLADPEHPAVYIVSTITF
ncbi:hypothetical protein AQ490_00495 [Wenjunlia vitaminophila]|uniref:Uncharacterized protein n=1 Tax=Wenjunlia vitaminophila TaxID=76728 RepID=A0A0T6LZ76_WENVI|nr:hypothetical protein [Wenjunlia vitaminophila]KRV51286.1 hypothetical protein AQ490_00495 [Wenjunlia vitaminophila]